MSLAKAPTNAVPVTADNFSRAETDMYFASDIKQAGAIGKLHHHREAMTIDSQTVVRTNRDTLYSTAVFDLDASPVNYPARLEKAIHVDARAQPRSICQR